VARPPAQARAATVPAKDTRRHQLPRVKERPAGAQFVPTVPSWGEAGITGKMPHGSAGRERSACSRSTRVNH